MQHNIVQRKVEDSFFKKISKGNDINFYKNREKDYLVSDIIVTNLRLFGTGIVTNIGADDSVFAILRVETSFVSVVVCRTGTLRRDT